MTAFAHVEYPTEHPGVVRAENAAAALKSAAARFDGARGAASLLLAAVVSALLVVANQVIDTWSEGHLLAAWMVLWVVAFAALALLTLPARRMALLTAGWVMESLCAARVRLRSAITSSKTRSRFRSRERKFKGVMVAAQHIHHLHEYQ